LSGTSTGVARIDRTVKVGRGGLFGIKTPVSKTAVLRGSAVKRLDFEPFLKL
jgi:hypothetical protein